MHQSIATNKTTTLTITNAGTHQTNTSFDLALLINESTSNPLAVV